MYERNRNSAISRMKGHLELSVLLEPMSTNNSPEPKYSNFSVLIIAHLTVHISGPGNKKKSSTKKNIKTKEFIYIFSITKANYLQFLTTFFTKHHISNKLQMTDRKHFTCKMQILPSKYIVPFDVDMINANYFTQVKEMHMMLKTFLNMKM